jgi:hypothetical protein
VSKAGKRYWRTIILGLVALAVLVWTAVDQFDIPMEDVRELLLGTVLAVVLVIGLAALVVLIWMGLRRLMRRD